MRRALDSFSIEVDEQQKVWRILAAVLSLGNIKFGAAAAQAGNDEEVAEVADAATLKAAARALGCTADALSFPLLNKNLVVMGNTIVKKFTTKGAAQARDSLAKTVYAALFDWVVGRINAVSRGPPGSHFIGILDIFGFEQLKTNSFEQLCINYVNEMLQEQFNETVFAAERRLLKAEGIEVDDSALQSSATRLSTPRMA